MGHSPRTDVPFAMVALKKASSFITMDKAKSFTRPAASPAQKEIKMTIAEIKREPRNKDTSDLLKHIVQQVEASEDATEVLAFVKIGKDYHRFSTGIADMMKLIAVLEVAKHDCISRMTTS